MNNRWAGADSTAGRPRSLDNAVCTASRDGQATAGPALTPTGGRPAACTVVAPDRAATSAANLTACIPLSYQRTSVEVVRENKQQQKKNVRRGAGHGAEVVGRGGDD